MDTVRTDAAGWDCLSCGRRVPGRIKACRCGFEQPDALEVPEQARAASPWGAGLPLLGIGLVLGAALALYPGRSPAPVEAKTVVATVPAAADPAIVPAEPIAVARLADDADSASPVGRAGLDDIRPTTSDTPAPRLEDLVSKVVPAVAFVQAGQNRGTGFFIARDRVITNAHVVNGQVSVRLQVGDASYPARVVTVSPGSDLAVLQVSNTSPDQPVLTMGSVTGARVGEEVIAVGSALGVLSNTVTRGIVSAVRKAGQITLIQTDAAINPGNSGGPLVNRAGLVIGINSLRAGQQAEGVAFAVAIDHATQLLNGERMSDSQTPLNNLTKILDGRSDGDQMRSQGEQDYARTLDAAARAAGEIDALWTRYSNGCVATAPSAGDRPWFAVFSPGAVRLTQSTSIDCPSWLDAVRTRADAVRADVERAAESARQRGVFPGVARDLRRKYRLQWDR
jgi:S1-C subfamily serine protease